jgi:nucleotide-binding universal stress UspA family protein
MFRNVVVGVDGGPGGREALALARVLAPDAEEVFGVHVFPYERNPSGASSASYEQALREEAGVLVERELAATGLSATPAASGDVDVAGGIERIARREHADLIVLGSSRRGPRGLLLGGQVAVGVIQRAGSGVALAPKGYGGEPQHRMRVLVAFDGSPEATAALRVARELAAGPDDRLHVLFAVEPPATFGVTATDRFDGAEVTLRRQAACRERLAAAIAAEGGCRATSEVVIGLPGEVLANASREADLLVMGSRACDTARRLRLGSTSARLLDTAACPLLVLRRAAIEPRAGGDARREGIAA